MNLPNLDVSKLCTAKNIPMIQQNLCIAQIFNVNVCYVNLTLNMTGVSYDKNILLS